MSRKNFGAAFVAFIAVAAALGLTQGRFAPVPAVQAASVQPEQPATRALPDFTALVEQNGPAVVNISTTARVHVQRQ